MKKLFLVIIVVGLVVALASLTFSARKDIPTTKKQINILDMVSTKNVGEAIEAPTTFAPTASSGEATQPSFSSDMLTARGPEGFKGVTSTATRIEKEPSSYISPPPDPNIILQGGDDCASATAITVLPYTDVGTTAGYTDDYDETCPYAGTGAPDVVYSYSPEVDTCIFLTLCTVETNYDTKMYVYQDECVSPYYACNDDACESVNFPYPYVSAIYQLRVYTGHTYYIIVDGYGAESGTYDLLVDYDLCPGAPPPNDDCANAEYIPPPYPTSGTGTCIDATVDCPGLLDWNGVWYTIDLPYVCNDVVIEVCGESAELGWSGIVLMDDCACDDYILSDEYAWDPAGCPNGYGFTMNFHGVAGPVTMYWPCWAADAAEVGIDFSYTVDITECGVCDVVCPPGGILEGEPPCGDEYVDNYNGGCNSTPYIFQAINDGDTICGESGTYLFGGSNYRDTDWYELVLTEEKQLTWCAVAEFPVLIFIIDGTAGCDGVILTSGTADPCDTVCIQYTVPAGTYWMWIGPSVFTGWPCVLEYVAWLDVEEPGEAPPNDLCEDAEWIPGPYPDTVWGTRVGATIDCPGVLDWDAVWYYFEAPYAANHIELNFCPTGDSIDYDITNGGIVLFNEPVDPEVNCPDDCSDYLSAVTYGGYEFPLWCPDEGINAYRVWWNLPGPAIYYLPVYLQPGQFGFGFEIDVTEEGVCDVTCPPGGILEGEPPCGDEYVDNYNGGCNSTPPIFQPINLGDIMCAESGTYLFEGSNYRDTDWFEWVCDETGTYSWSAVGEFPILIFFIDATPGCPDPIIMSSATADPCDTAILIENLTAGTTYWLWAGPSVFAGWDCVLEYVAWFDSEEPQYCPACYTNTTDDYISNVTFNTINNTTGFEGAPCSYGDYTSISTDVATGEIHTLTVSVWSMGMYTECVSAFFDWNQDLDWDDAGERYDLGCGIDPILSMDIAIPYTATLGSTRIRVIEEYYSYPIDACPNSSYGEIEDYTVNISQGAAPTFSVDPTSLEGAAAPGGSDTGVLSVSNVGEAGSVLNFTCNATIDPMLQASEPIGPATDWIIGESTNNPDAQFVNTLEDKAPDSGELNVPQPECPEGTLWSQAPHLPEDSWSFATSDIGSPGPYCVYDNYVDVFSPIEGIFFWGLDLMYPWAECFEDPMTFEIIFYEDAAGVPGAVVATFTETITPVPNGYLYSGFECNEYTCSFDPPVVLPTGWVSIQGISEPLDCWFMWGSSREIYDGHGYQWDGSSMTDYFYDCAFCLLGEYVEPWLTIDIDGGSIPYGDPPIDITATMDAADLEEGTYTGSINFTTNDVQNPNPTVPVTFVVGGGCDYVPGDANGDGNVMGNDVTYSVRYFKGLGNPPPDSCPYQGGWLYSGGDANGNCSYTGSDVTFLVGYFKGYNPAILYCPDTPPAGGGVTAIIRGDKAIVPKNH